MSNSARRYTATFNNARVRDFAVYTLKCQRASHALPEL